MNTSRENRDRKRREAEARNSLGNAAVRVCGHVHGVGVGCNGRESIDLRRVSA